MRIDKQNLKCIANLYRLELEDIFIFFEEEYSLMVYKFRVCDKEGVDIGLHTLPNKESLVSIHVESIQGSIEYIVELRYKAVGD
jgi:hypothetical protein